MKLCLQTSPFSATAQRNLHQITHLKLNSLLPTLVSSSKGATFVVPVLAMLTMVFLTLK